jgi:hypothetical protein
VNHDVTPYSLTLRLTCLALLALAPLATAQDSAAIVDPAVASILDRPRETPAQQLEALFLLLDLGQQDVAESLWKDFSGQTFDAPAQADLVQTLGAARFLNLSRRATGDQLPGARAFAQNCLRAAAQTGRTPQALAALLERLSDPDAEVRAAARSDLAVTGDPGAVACLEALADASGEGLRTELMRTLAKMRPGVEPLLIAALADGEGTFRRDVVELCGYLRLQKSVPWLAALATGGDPAVQPAANAALAKLGLSAPNTEDARVVVRRAIHRLETQLPAEPGPWWSLQAESAALVARDSTAAEKQLFELARLARLLGKLPSAPEADRRLALLYAYQVADALQQPLPEDLQQWALTTGQLNQTLHDALQNDQLAAAVACVKRLATGADPAALASVDGLPGPLARALVHPNQQLKFAALEAVMQIAPQRSFAGASGVVQALWFFAGGDGAPQAIAAAPVVARASDWAGQLRSAGYEATPTSTGREVLRTALDAPRLELILLDSDIGRPLMREVIYSLRSNPSLARVPVAVLSSLPNLARAEQIAAQDRWVVSTPRPHSDEAMQAVLARLGQLDGAPPSSATRTTRAVAALGWIADLLQQGHPYDELLRDSQLVNQTVLNPNLTDSSLRVLALLGTADSQRQLVNYASTSSLSLATRRQARDAFAQSAERFGKLLTSQELLRQYDRYNTSETADLETQEVLGSLLDTLEKK